MSNSNIFKDYYLLLNILKFTNEADIVSLSCLNNFLNKTCKEYIDKDIDHRFEIKINDEELEKYIQNNNIIKLSKLIKTGKDIYWDYGLVVACCYSNMNIVKLMIDHGANNWNWGLSGACQGGHIDIIKFMIERGANKWNRGLEGACMGGHMNIINLMIEKGAIKCYNCGKSIEYHKKSVVKNIH